jgi:hypothetical protein
MRPDRVEDVGVAAGAVAVGIFAALVGDSAMAGAVAWSVTELGDDTVSGRDTLFSVDNGDGEGRTDTSGARVSLVFFNSTDFEVSSLSEKCARTCHCDFGRRSAAPCLVVSK